MQSWSQSVSVLLPSCVSLSEFSWVSFLSQCRFSDFQCCLPSSFVCVFFLFVQMGRSIFRFAYSIHLSCSFVKVHVPHALPNAGENTTFNKRDLGCRGYNLDVNSCLYLQNDAPNCSDSASVFRRFSLLKSYCLSETLHALLHKKHFDIDIADRHFLLFARTLVAEDLRLSGCIFNPAFSVLRLKSHNMLLQLLQRCCM